MLTGGAFRLGALLPTLSLTLKVLAMFVGGQHQRSTARSGCHLLARPAARAGAGHGTRLVILYRRYHYLLADDRQADLW